MTFKLEDVMMQSIKSRAGIGHKRNSWMERKRKDSTESNCELTLIINLLISIKQRTTAKQKPLKQHQNIKKNKSDKSSKKSNTNSL